MGGHGARIAWLCHCCCMLHRSRDTKSDEFKETDEQNVFARHRGQLPVKATFLFPARHRIGNMRVKGVLQRLAPLLL